jgi:hypothetical protein
MMGPPNANARKLKKLAFKIIKTLFSLEASQIQVRELGPGSLGGN